MMDFGFKHKLLLSILTLVALTVGSSNYLSYLRASEAFRNSLNQGMQEQVSLEAQKVTTYIQSKTSSVSSIAADYRRYQYTTEHAQRMRVAALAAHIPALTIGFANGDAYASYANDIWVNGKNPDSYDPRKRGWYQDAMRTPEVIYTEPYHDATTGEPMVSIGQQAGNGAVVLADIPLTILSDTVKKINLKNAVSLISDENGTILASNNSTSAKTGSNLSNSPIAAVRTQIFNHDHNILEYQVNNIDKLMFTQKIQYGDKNWYLMIGLEKKQVFRQLATMKYKAIALSATYIVLSILVTLLVLHFLYRPILALKKTIVGLSQGNGDLTQRLEVSSHDDLGQIADGVNKFIASLQRMMLEIRSSTDALQDNIIRLKDQSENNASIINLHVQETEQIVTAIEEMSATADSVAQNASDAAQFTKKAATISSDVLVIMDNSKDKVISLVDEVDSTASSLQAMSEETKDITAVLTVIGEIAEQTNLLALNAAIEAARAGEQGRGFAVVADEVRALASRTQSSTEEIEQALNRLLSRSTQVVNAMNTTKTTCQETSDSSDQVSQSITSLTEQVSGITELSIQIATAAEEQSNVSQEISRNMSSINEMVTQLNQNGEETVHQTNSIDEVNSGLVNIINQFKLK